MKTGKLEPKIQRRIVQNFEDRTTIRRRKMRELGLLILTRLTPHAGGDKSFHARHDRHGIEVVGAIIHETRKVEPLFQCVLFK